MFLGYRSFPVIIEPSKPLICYSCQRLGRHSAQCKLPRACKRCGAQGHLAKGCPNAVRCVNCKGSHIVGSNVCPRVVFVAEKNRLLMEARVLRYVKAGAPSATLSAEPQTPSGQTSGPRIADEDVVQTYASVIRSITVTEGRVSEPAVLLPKPKVLPRRSKSRIRRQTEPKRRRPLRKLARVSGGAATKQWPRLGKFSGPLKER